MSDLTPVPVCDLILKLELLNNLKDECCSDAL